MPQDDHDDDIQVVVFSDPGGDVSFTINGDRDTIWGTRQEIAEVFGCGEENVRQHIRNLYKEGELDEKSTSKKFLEVQVEGGRSVKRQVERFNLDVILSLGYRVSSRKATLFRQWANRTLREFITTGYVLNEKKLSEDEGAQRELFKKLRAIRHDEKAMYAKVRDVFKVSASDYNAHSQAAKPSSPWPRISFTSPLPARRLLRSSWNARTQENRTWACGPSKGTFQPYRRVALARTISPNGNSKD